MEKLIPYVNVETVAEDGVVSQFVVRVAAMVPDDSTVTQSPIVDLADNVQYRPLSMYYDGTSTTYTCMDVEFTIEKDNVGLLERGVCVSLEKVEASESLRDVEKKGQNVDYEDAD